MHVLDRRAWTRDNAPVAHHRSSHTVALEHSGDLRGNDVGHMVSELCYV